MASFCICFSFMRSSTSQLHTTRMHVVCGMIAHYCAGTMCFDDVEALTAWQPSMNVSLQKSLAETGEAEMQLIGTCINHCLCCRMMPCDGREFGREYYMFCSLPLTMALQ